MSDQRSVPTAGGLFLSLDGPDGGGKTTQIPRLVDWLRSTGREVVACRDPGSTELGLDLRRLLFDRRSRLGLRAEMLLFMAARAQLVEEVIRPALDSGGIVVSDRYVLANLVYQGHAGGLRVDEIRHLGAIATGGTMPDLTIVLDVPPDLAAERTGAPRDRIEDRPLAYRQAVREGFLAEAAADPQHIKIIDASVSPDAVFRAIQTEVQRVLGTGPRP